MTALPFQKLAIIAGRGELPLEIAGVAQQRGADVHVIVLRDQGDSSDYGAFPHDVVRIGAAGTAINLLKEKGISDIVFAGGVRRPSLLELRPDAKASQILGVGLLRLGDDGLLRAVLSFLEEREGFTIHTIDSILEDIQPKPGQLGRIPVPDSVTQDIRRGQEILSVLSEQDIGQSIVVQEGVVLGMEAVEGTDALIARCADLAREGQGPVLVKMSKTGQSLRVDLPTIGPNTIRNCAEAGFSGIAVEANRSLVVARDKTVQLADEKELFLVAVPGRGGE